LNSQLKQETFFESTLTIERRMFFLSLQE